MSFYDPHATNVDRSIPVNTPTSIDGQIVLKPHDPNWVAMYDIESAHVRQAALCHQELHQHVGVCRDQE